MPAYLRREDSTRFVPAADFWEDWGLYFLHRCENPAGQKNSGPHPPTRSAQSFDRRRNKRSPLYIRRSKAFPCDSVPEGLLVRERFLGEAKVLITITGCQPFSTPVLQLNYLQWQSLPPAIEGSSNPSIRRGGLLISFSSGDATWRGRRGPH
jgi:hypothetical protein